MRLPLTAALVLLVCVSSNAVARGPLGEPHAMFYFQLPFDGATGEEQHSTFGFRMDQIHHAPDDTVDYRRLMQQPPILDLKMDHDGIRSFTVSGTDYLRLYRTLHADATTETTAADQAGEGAAETGGKGVPVGKKAALDFWDVITTLWEETPAGVLIGVGFGAALAAGVGG
jgi:hypothetical protein